MKTQTLEEFIKETRFDFDKTFPCLVKPRGYVFEKNGEKREVEGITGEAVLSSTLCFIKN